jgi:hypothetical protein
MNKTLAIATVLKAAALTRILSTNPIAFAQDESETSAEQEIKQRMFVADGQYVQILLRIEKTQLLELMLHS